MIRLSEGNLTGYCDFTAGGRTGGQSGVLVQLKTFISEQRHLEMDNFISESEMQNTTKQF